MVTRCGSDATTGNDFGQPVRFIFSRGAPEREKLRTPGWGYARRPAETLLQADLKQHLKRSLVLFSTHISAAVERVDTGSRSKHLSRPAPRNGVRLAARRPDQRRYGCSIRPPPVGDPWSEQSGSECSTSSDTTVRNVPWMRRPKLRDAPRDERVSGNRVPAATPTAPER